MYHITPAFNQQTKEVNYEKLLSEPTARETPKIPDGDNDNVPEAPDGFAFYRVKSGDTLVSLSVRFAVSQNKIRRYNNKACFGHRLSHLVGKLLLIPLDPSANLTQELKDQLSDIYTTDETESKDNNSEQKMYEEPDENGKYQLRKALMYHTRDVDTHRADYYLGEANWNVRKALNLWKKDDKWEKQQSVMKACSVTNDEALQLLENYHWDVSKTILFYMKEHKKNKDKNGDTNENEGKTTKLGGSTELVDLNKDVTDEGDNDDNNNQESNMVTRFCCGSSIN